MVEARMHEITWGKDVAFFVRHVNNKDLRAVNTKNGNFNSNDEDVSFRTDEFYVFF